MSTRTSAICIITIRPHIDFLEFYKDFKDYDVIFMIDDISYDTTVLQSAYPTIRFVQIPNEECNKHGFKYSSYMQNSSLVFNEIIAWDRALYYFTYINAMYDHVWFLEDDVFVYGEESFTHLDTKYKNSDILCRDKNHESKPDEWQWFWPAIHIQFERPYFHSPICAVRMSKRLLSHIRDYIDQHKRMVFIEAMFPTIAHRYNLIYDRPEEFQKLVWRNDWKQSDLTKLDFVHPIKDLSKHKIFRMNM
jgi:hypothetical protein